MDDKDRTRALGLTLSQIEKQFGKGSIMRLGEDAVLPDVKSIPTGHQVMHRPQPTQPDEPNWSCQVTNLCSSHWR